MLPGRSRWTPSIQECQGSPGRGGRPKQKTEEEEESKEGTGGQKERDRRELFAAATTTQEETGRLGPERTQARAVLEDTRGIGKSNRGARERERKRKRGEKSTADVAATRQESRPPYGAVLCTKERWVT